MAPPPSRSALLGLYLTASRRGAGVARRLLARRLREGKEDPARLTERMGEATAARPEGRLAWFHAASIGEAVSLIELLRRLTADRHDVTCLVTTVTLTSAQFLATRLPERCIHQFAPLDIAPWIERFLDHWRPDLAVRTESELWPATLWAAHARGIPLLLVNGRISQRSFRRWRSMRGMAASLLGRFERILAQDALAGGQLTELGADPARLSVTGSLKEGAAPLAHSEPERQRVSRAFAGRPIWVAASTHEGEEEIIGRVHARARKALPMLALILVPRHPVRAEAIAAMLRGQGWQVARRSLGEEITADTDVYLADTLGEMGIWYRIGAVGFVGGSLAEVGGHNPFEPALLGCAILHGPHVRNFREAYARLHRAGAAIEVRTEAELGEALIPTLAPDRAARMAAAAWDAVSEGADVIDDVMGVVLELLDRPPDRPADRPEG